MTIIRPAVKREIGSRLTERNLAVIDDLESKQAGLFSVMMVTLSSRLAPSCRFSTSDGDLMPGKIAKPEADEKYGQ
jgi:hypothetical protein